MAVLHMKPFQVCIWRRAAADTVQPDVNVEIQSFDPQLALLRTMQDYHIACAEMACVAPLLPGAGAYWLSSVQVLENNQLSYCVGVPQYP